MHHEAYTYTHEALIKVGGAMARRVLEIGSVNINGSARDLCVGAAAYVGIDKEAGPGVDVVTDARDYVADELFDLVICNEVLEHDPRPGEIVQTAWRALRPGGILILTCAGTNRKPHGARGTEHPLPGEYYRNVSGDELRALLDGWIIHDLSELYPPGDTRCIAEKP